MIELNQVSGAGLARLGDDSIVSLAVYTSMTGDRVTGRHLGTLYKCL